MDGSPRMRDERTRCMPNAVHARLPLWHTWHTTACVRGGNMQNAKRSDRSGTMVVDSNSNGSRLSLARTTRTDIHEHHASPFAGYSAHRFRGEASSKASSVKWNDLSNDTWVLLHFPGQEGKDRSWRSYVSIFTLSRGRGAGLRPR